MISDGSRSVSKASIENIELLYRERNIIKQKSGGFALGVRKSIIEEPEPESDSSSKFNTSNDQS